MTEAFEQKNGVLTLEQATELGFSKESVRKAYRRGDVIKADRGIYLLDDSFEDDLYIMQLKYSKGVYSYESSVYAAWINDIFSFFVHYDVPQRVSLKNKRRTVH